MTTLLVKNIHTLVFIQGKKVVDQGRLTTLDLEILVEKTNQIARQMIDGKL